jgi:ABC-type branched-subunit amino acid transport system permease subunit
VLQSWFSVFPHWLQDLLVTIFHPFMGKGWNLTLGLLFMLVVIFLPGGLIEGGNRLMRLTRRRRRDDGPRPSEAPAE